MTSMRDMQLELTDRLGVKVDDIFAVADIISTDEQATKAAEYLNLQILMVELDENDHFCESGLITLKKAYNKIHDKFPEVTEKVHPKYE